MYDSIDEIVEFEGFERVAEMDCEIVPEQKKVVTAAVVLNDDYRP